MKFWIRLTFSWSESRPCWSKNRYDTSVGLDVFEITGPLLPDCPRFDPVMPRGFVDVLGIRTVLDADATTPEAGVLVLDDVVVVTGRLGGGTIWTAVLGVVPVPMVTIGGGGWSGADPLSDRSQHAPHVVHSWVGCLDDCCVELFSRLCFDRADRLRPQTLDLQAAFGALIFFGGPHDVVDLRMHLVQFPSRVGRGVSGDRFVIRVFRHAH